jgi:predicted metallopeptidase
MLKHNLRGFDFTLYLRRLCEDMSQRLAELRHIDISRVAISFVQTRKAVPHGIYATLVPLRFEGGKAETVRSGRRYRIQQLLDPSHREMLYLLNFYLPRFLNLAPAEKLSTVIHELWHISPRFDGDLRRFRGRCYAHSGSQKRYDAHADRLVRRWLALDPPAAVHAFLEHDFRGLVRRHGKVFGQRIRAPRIIPVR